MSIHNNAERYGSLSIALHWVMVLLMAGVYACIELREWYPKGSAPREALKTWHFMLGLSVFALVWVRLAVFRLRPAPPIHPEPPRWQMLLAKLMHVALYGLMIAMPLMGWVLLSAGGKPIPFFGLELPPLVAESRNLSWQLKDWHETGGQIGYFLIGLHAAAALYHHHVVRDDTLRRMLPYGRRA